MTERERILRRQAEWQKSRQAVPWPEKIRQAERMRASIEAFRRMRTAHQPPVAPVLPHGEPTAKD